MQPKKDNPYLNRCPNNQSIMNPRMEEGGYLNLTPLADPAITTEQKQNHNAVCPKSSGEAMNTPFGGDRNVINSQTVPKCTIIAAPDVLSMFEEDLAEEAATGIKRPQKKQGNCTYSKTDPTQKIDYKELRAQGLAREAELAAAGVVYAPRIMFSDAATHTPQRRFIELHIKNVCCKSCVAAAEALATCECLDDSLNFEFGGSGLKRPGNDSDTGTTDSLTTAPGKEVQIENAPVLKRPHKDPHVSISSGDS